MIKWLLSSSSRPWCSPCLASAASPARPSALAKILFFVAIAIAVLMFLFGSAAARRIS